ncbi:unnamed protein product [Anisakis simplex]|uniref:Uncharacterized protein n=1 Tax=Anisakis simplex TaxID=6269 RepID=A0A0M3JTY2_ANISI|nr:unnamed protein product [Anisakis simplex]
MPTGRKGCASGSFMFQQGDFNAESARRKVISASTELEPEMAVDGYIRNHIDYILSSSKRIISDVTFIEEKSIDSGHRLARIIIKVNFSHEKAVLKKRTQQGEIVNMASLARKLEAQDWSMTATTWTTITQMSLEKSVKQPRTNAIRLRQEDRRDYTIAPKN